MRKKMKEEEKKKKISISIDDDVFEAMEDYVEKTDGEKRSRLIERLLKKYNNNK